MGEKLELLFYEDKAADHMYKQYVLLVSLGVDGSGEERVGEKTEDVNV